jgi:hypothetical protein
MNQADIKARVQHWIKAQHGTAGWEIKLENLVADMVLRVIVLMIMVVCRRFKVFVLDVVSDL